MLLTDYEKIIFNKQIQEMLGNEHLEFEVRFGNKTTSEQFRAIIQRLKQLNLKKHKSEEELDIFFKTDRSKKSNFRITLKGKKNILEFCKNNKMPYGDTDVDKVYKNRYYWSSETLEEINQVIDEKISSLGQKSKIALINSQKKKLNKIANLDVYNYKFRTSLSWEIPYQNVSPLEPSIKHTYENELRKYKLLLHDNNKLENYLKFFRYKKRLTYYSKDELFKIDLTVTKSSNFSMNSGFSNSYVESGLLEQPENYEIELEYTGPKYKQVSDIHTNTNIVLNSLIKNVGVILQVLQRSFYLISKDEEIKVIQSYKELVSFNIMNRISRKKEILEKYSEYLDKKDEDAEDAEIFWKDAATNLDIISEIKYPKYFFDLLDNTSKKFGKQFDIKKESEYLHSEISKFKSEKEPVYNAHIDKLNNPKSNYLSRKNLFIGPKPITIEIPHLYNKSPVNILYDYTVTDKADGLGCILYIPGTSGLMGSLNTYENTLISGISSFTCQETSLKISNLVTETSGGGQGAVISLEISENKIINIKNNSGKGYEIGDKITISSTTLLTNGCKCDNDLVITLGTEHIINYNDIVNNVYLIDTNLKIIKTGIKCNDLSDIILNGELIYSKNIPHYLAYDIYVSSESGDMIDCINYPFIVDQEEYVEYSRLEQIKSIVEKIQPSCNHLFSINCKTFYESVVTEVSSIEEEEHQSISDIFSQSKELWDKNLNSGFNYRLDGMIYTPKYLPVAYSNNFDYDIRTGVTWNYNLKWKPADENSIDFFVKIEQEKINDTLKKDKIRHHFIKTEYGNKVIPYKTLYLYSGSRTIKRIGDSEFYSYEARKFIPSTPYDNEAYIAKIPLTGSQILGIYDNQSIENNTVVEFTYLNFNNDVDNYEKNKGFRWTPLRTRIDKTSKYREGYHNKFKNFQLFKSMIIDRNIYQILHSTLSNILIDDSGYIGLHQSIISSQNRHDFLHNFQSLVRYLQGSILDIEKNIKKDSKKSYISRKIIDFGRLLKYSVNSYKIKSNDIPYDLNNQTIKDTLCSFLHGSNLELLKNIHTENDLKVDVQYGNDFKTSNNIWKNIHYPITTEMITTGQDIPNESDYQIYYDSLEHRSQTGLYNMQVYHNKFIKGELLLGMVTSLLKENSNQNISLLDMGCGKGGDLHKWKLYDIDNVLGIDVVPDNILNDTNGAQLRYLNLKYQSEQLTEKTPIVNFLIGDCSKNLRDYSAFNDHKTKASEILPIISKFDIISSQFAFHYFFKNQNSFDNIIKNLNENLADGGYFIGTCFDGKNIVNLLKGQTEITGTKKGRIIWKIKKNIMMKQFLHQETKIL